MWPCEGSREDYAYLGMSFDTPVPPFPHLPNGDDNITHPVGLLWEGNESGVGFPGWHTWDTNHVSAVPTKNLCYKLIK